MYIFELIAKIIKDLKEKKSPIFPHKIENEDPQECENHIYLAIDSTREYLACKNCGHIIKNKNNR